MEKHYIEGHKIQVKKFGGPEQLKLKQIKIAPPKKGEVRIKVLAISVGITDLMARSGKYLLQPFTPLTPGYDCVGEVVDWHHDAEKDLLQANQKKGTRVAVCLPQMGTYVSHLCIRPWQIVTIPDSLDTIKAAAVPLDYLTAWSLVKTHAQIKKGQSILIHGASGAVGSIATQLAVSIGANVYGTGSIKNKKLIESFGAYFLDYAADNWQDQLLENNPNGMDSVLLHFSGKLLKHARKITKRHGIVVNFAFMGDKQGREKVDTLFGALSIKFRQLVPWKTPKSAICSLPSEIRSKHNWYRDTLFQIFNSVSNEDIRVDYNHIYSLNKASEAHEIVEGKKHNGKIILTCNYKNRTHNKRYKTLGASSNTGSITRHKNGGKLINHNTANPNVSYRRPSACAKTPQNCSH